MAYVQGNLTFYIYGENEAPAGTGLGKQFFPDIVTAQSASGQKFEDPLFPADSTSLGDLSLNYSDGTAMDIQWKRPAEISQALFQTPPIFQGTLNEFDVSQGVVGDCWFLSVLADIADKPKCIETLVPSDNQSVGFDTGVFHFRFWCRGKWVDVPVDDRLPCIMWEGKITGTAFCTPSKVGGFWSSLVEKAYAKMYGKYESIKGGYGVDAMLDFTGGYVQSFDSTDPDWVKNILVGKATDAIMAIGTSHNIPDDLKSPPDPTNPGSEDVSIEGIVGGHEYSLLDVQTEQSLSDSTLTYTLLKLRNPWGNKTVWNGDFSAADPNNAWADVAVDLRSQTGVANDGEFWITPAAIKKYADSLDMCRWSPEFRGDKTETLPNGATCFVTTGNFNTTDSGEINYATDLKGKGGFYVHLKPLNESETGEIKNGFNYNCGLSGMMIYCDYSKSGTDKNIPEFGFYMLWAPGYVTPTDDDFFNNVVEFKNGLTDTVRRSSDQWNMPAGTALFVPWLTNGSDAQVPYYFRILAEGKVYSL